jgi:hypothetical protein
MMTHYTKIDSRGRRKFLDQNLEYRGKESHPGEGVNRTSATSQKRGGEP